MQASTHLIRNFGLLASAIAITIIAAAVFEGRALVVVVTIMAVGVVAAILPFVVIHYDQHDELLRPRR